MEINVTVDGQNMSIPSYRRKYVSGSQEFVKFIFYLSEDWTDLTAFAQFTQGDDSYNVYLDEDGAAYLPAEIGPGNCRIMLYGTGGDVIGTTNAISIYIDDSGFVADAESTEITESLYNQLVAIVKAATTSPLVASEASGMTDTTRIYVYTGSETGYRFGHWYYYDGTAWTDGGTYGSMDIGSMFDGTKRTYDRIMRKWFLANGVNALSSDGITELCSEWYRASRDGWCGYTSFAQPSVSAVSTGTKGGDNASRSCTPSTDTVAGQDDYAGLPLFACKDVNYEVDADTLDIVITAIEGVTDNFTRYDPEKFVGVMQMTGYHFWREDSGTYTHGYTDTLDSTLGNIQPLPESVKVDGTVRPFVVHGKYYSHTESGKMTSYSGVVPTAWVSHNTLHTLSAATGSQYSGGCIIDWSFLVLMTYIKYASLTLDGIMQGCCAYNYQLYAQVSETGVKRIILPSAAISQIIPGSSVLVGNYAGNADRGQAAMYSISGQSGFIVTAVEAVTIDGTTYTAVYVDTDETFDTVANGSATSGTTVVSTFHWKTGTTDAVLGNDGSPVSNTSGRYPYKLQGIEVMNGGYEVLTDVILNLAAADDGETYYTPCVVNRSANQATSVTANYESLTALRSICPSAQAWTYVVRLGFTKGVFFQTETGTVSSQYTKDGFYKNAKGTTGTREYLAFGLLSNGAGLAGLSCLAGYTGLSTASWYCLARLSPNGNRGELAA